MFTIQTAKIGSLVDVNESQDAEGLRVFYYLVQDLKVCWLSRIIRCGEKKLTEQCFIFSLITLHFKIKPSELPDCSCAGIADKSSPTVKVSRECVVVFRSVVYAAMPCILPTVCQSASSCSCSPALWLSLLNARTPCCRYPILLHCKMLPYFDGVVRIASLYGCRYHTSGHSSHIHK